LSGVEACYGEQGPGVRRVCGEALRVEEMEGGLCLYRRGGVEVLLPSCRLSVYPVQPILYPERLTGYVMLVLERPLALPAGGEASVCLLGGHDAAVYAGPEGGIIDAFPVGAAKYALYGPPSRGVLARWVPARIADCGSPQACSMLVEVRAVNEAADAVLLRRIVYPAASIPLAYRGCQVLGPRLTVVAYSPVSARVYAEPPAERPGWSPAPPLVARGGGVAVAQLPWGEQRISYTMLHGL